MSLYSININKACHNSHQKDCCYETCHDWFQNNQSQLEECKSICKNHSNCNFTPREPVIFYQNPAYFPDKFKETNDIQQAKNACLNMCNSNECRNKCQRDANAIEISQTYINALKNTETHTNKWLHLLWILCICISIILIIRIVVKHQQSSQLQGLSHLQHQRPFL